MSTKKYIIIALVIASLMVGTIASASWWGNLFGKNQVDQNLGASVFQIFQGGTGTSTKPTVNKMLIADSNGNWEYTATSSLGITATMGTLNDLSDVVITGTDYGKLLMFNGTNWINQATSTLGLTVSETDPVWTGVSGDYLLTANAFTQAIASTTFQPIITANTYDVYGQATGTITIHNAAYNHANYDTAFGWGNHLGLYDVLGQATGTIAIHNAAYNHSNYDTAYGWGNHASQEYMKTAFATSTYFQLATWFATTTKANLTITKSQVSDFGTYENPLTFNYPLSRATNAISIVATSSMAINTDDLVEGTNKFYADALVDTHLSGGTGITYTTGAISFDCSEVEGTGIDCSGENITLNNTGAWAGTYSAFGSDFYTYFNATTTDYLTQGSTNLYNQTHSGEVTGATALTIADNIIDEANLKMSTLPTNNFVLIASSSASGGMDWVATSSALLNLGTGGGGDMVYPGAGIALSTGSAWGTSITDDSIAWNNKWDLASSTIGVAYGGTGATTLTDGGILLGSGTGALTPMGVLADGAIVVGDGTTDPVALTAFTSSTGYLKHESGGLEFDASAITTGGIIRGSGAGTMAILALGTGGQILGVTGGQLGYISTSTITTLSGLVSVSTITTGTWQGTSIGTAYGGTGLGAGGLKAASIPFGNGTSAFATSTALQFNTSGSLLTVTNITSTSATTTNMVVGADGAAKAGCLAIQDVDKVGWSYCYLLNGTMSCSQVDCSGTATSTLQIGR